MLIKNLVLSAVFILLHSQCLIGQSRGGNIHIPASIDGNYLMRKHGTLGEAHIACTAIELRVNDPNSYLLLTWDGLPADHLNHEIYLRISLASDLVSFDTLIFHTGDGKPIGVQSIALGSPFQMYQIIIPEKYLRSVEKYGVQITVAGTGSGVEIISGSAHLEVTSLPHILISGETDRKSEFLERMASRSSLTVYGWQEGCVLDGLSLLSERASNADRFTRALEDHLNIFYPSEDSVKGLQGTRGIEFTTCVGQLAHKNPTHPDVQAMLVFWESRKNDLGVINDGTTTVAEGNYTVAWPMALIAKKLDRGDLAEAAIVQLRARRDRLVDDSGAIWLRADAQGRRTYKLWARGLTWYFLGMAKTLDVLPYQPEDLIEEFQRAAEYLMKLQGNDGQWRGFADDTNAAPETSGTAGIATALAIGHRRGWLGVRALESAQRASKALENRLTPDGFLDGVAEANKREGGETFQRSTKGGFCQWGMGLYAQLIAELNTPVK
jgi:rhamnogalacturonyl hydrolase YesR